MTRRRFAAAAIATLAATIVAAAQTSAGRFAYERPAIANGTGPQRLPIDHALVIGGNPFRVRQRGPRFVAENGLSDLRLFDASGRPVPYLLVHAPDTEPEWIAGTVLAVMPTKKSSGFEADFGRAQRIDMLRVEGIPAPFLKRLSVEASGDRARWTMLASEATLFDLPAERLRQIEVGFTPGEYRYIRVTWDDSNSGLVPAPRGVHARLGARAEAPSQAPMELTLERQASEPGRSRYRIRLPAARLPLIGLELEVGGGHVFRTALITESRFAGSEAAPVELGRATLSRVVRDGVQASDLKVPIAPPVESDLQMLIDDGSNPPLEVKRVFGRLAELPSVYVEAPAGDLVARYGDRSLQAPAYDLEAVRASIDITRVPIARWGDVRALVASERTETEDAGSERVPPGGAIDAAGFRYLRSIAAVPSGLAALQLDAAVLAHSRGPSHRFADLRILDDGSRQIPYLLERRDEPLAVDVALTAAKSSAAELNTAPGRQQSVYKLTLPFERLPSATLVLETSGRVFQRNVQLGREQPPDRSHRDVWFQEFSSASWRHADRETAAVSLALPVAQTDQRELLLVVDEGDNAPLPLTGARLLLPSYRVRFYHPGGAALRLAYGRDDLQAPRYDLALLSQHVMGAATRDVVAAPASTDSTRSDPGQERLMSPLTFWVLLGGAAIVLVGLIVRLVKQTS